MRVLGRMLTGMAVVLGMAGPAIASPEGIWEIEMRDSRYAVELCGEDDKELCGTLIWLGRGANSPENRPYLNTMMIDHAREVGRRKWQGDLHIYGQTASGTITQVDDDEIKLEGCVLFFVCKSYRLYRYDD